MQLNKRLATFSLTAAVLLRPEWVILDGEVCSWQILSARTIFCTCDPHGKTGLMNFHHRREKKKTTVTGREIQISRREFKFLRRVHSSSRSF